ncbi:uncharacterized protein LOC111370807 [Olea europaea var. sylvestris]|uniref:uncharacterized protein LOC111370807 n=1 Tax=Olea europaea var. sylvestris TaxID=158386 RepID=UPI000C1D0B0A|nr:uncharacterized protein LOC111370807 [Olea europaea var. sylvestris]
MGLTLKEELLDFFLVPSGLLLMLGYHLFHLHRCLNFPNTTVIGYENHNKKAWVLRTLQVEAKERGQAIAVINSNISAATSLASMSLALSSLMGAWLGSVSHNDFISSNIYGNKSSTAVSIKYIALLSCFLVAFVCFVQTVRCFVNANFLISMPDCEVPTSHVENAVIRGSNYWVIALRSLIFASNLLLWIFGPIPMFVFSVITVVVLHNLDKNTTPLPQYKTTPVSYHPEKNDKEMTAVNSTNDSCKRLDTAEEEHQASDYDQIVCEANQQYVTENYNGDERG